MKKIMIMAMLLPTVLFAQVEKDTTKVITKEKHTLSINLNASDPSTMGLSFERKIKDSKSSAYVLNLSIGAMTVDNGFGDEFEGEGFVIESGTRTYFNEIFRGWYAENFLTYGDIKFKESLIGINTFESKYSFFSLFNTNIGYKFNAGSFSIDPSLGYIWKWEIKNEGFENKNVDNFTWRAGIKVGYRF